MEASSAPALPAAAEPEARQPNQESATVTAPSREAQSFSFSNRDYSSTVVELPLRVVDLVRQYEKAVERTRALTRCLEQSKSGSMASPVGATVAAFPVTSTPDKTRAKSPIPGVLSGKIITGKRVGKETNETPIQGATVVEGSNGKALQKLREEYNELQSELQRNRVDAALLADCRTQLRQREEEILQLRAARAENATPLDDTVLYAERLFYENVRAAAAQEKVQKEVSFLKEKNAQLEGQLQRLLTSSLDHFPSARAEGPTTKAQPVVTDAAHVAEKEALEKQIVDLNATLEKYRTRFKKDSEWRHTLQEENKKLHEVNGEMQASIVVFRRQLNERELDLVRQDAAAVDQQRLRTLEKECARLRHTMRERLSVCDHEYAVLQEELQGSQTKNRVYAKAVAHLQRVLLPLQVRAMAARPPAHKAVVVRAASPATPPPAAEVHHAVVRVEGVVAAPSAGAPIPLVGVVASREKQLEELKLTYDRRVEAAEALKRAEIKQVQVLNRELRQALADSQEQLQRKDRIIEKLKQTGRHGVADVAMSPDTTMTVGSPEHSMRLSPTNDRDGHRMSVALSEMEMRYDPENMSEWEAVHLENEVLLQRLSIMQGEKWSMSGHIEDLQLRCAAQQMELHRNAEFMQRMIHVRTAAGGEEDANIRFLQSLLQETLAKNMKLEEEVHDLNLKLGR
ncbi:GRIP1 associated protein 1 [Strigomonas culicis]|uniref:GRIP1 associated protein 1 n=1 Tax=Strigomonas culicis TaxID=28005 RepID=S9VDE3_9TRYP|nr:GRIP1 associated protein 1 [Strigomonas culicis]EPY28328.1 GRIP1 associated protein 1 [Strigomonas culicis]|eukprot:EPY25016.1 GRIP1 associated protein 1 [Strigomonas culicis]